MQDMQHGMAASSGVEPARRLGDGNVRIRAKTRPATRESLASAALLDIDPESNRSARGGQPQGGYRLRPFSMLISVSKQVGSR
jgi:hypothetical protein